MSRQVVWWAGVLRNFFCLLWWRRTLEHHAAYSYFINLWSLLYNRISRQHHGIKLPSLEEKSILITGYIPLLQQGDQYIRTRFLWIYFADKGLYTLLTHKMYFYIHYLKHSPVINNCYTSCWYFSQDYFHSWSFNLSTRLSKFIWSFFSSILMMHKPEVNMRILPCVGIPSDPSWLCLRSWTREHQSASPDCSGDTGWCSVTYISPE